MLAGALITVREGLEAFLIVGILLGYLTKLSQAAYKRYVWAGTAAAVLLSIGLAWAFQVLTIQFEGQSAQIFEVAVALTAVGVLTWMVLWMQRQSRSIKGELEQKVQAALSTHQVYALAGLAFVSVLREGLETALFLSALLFSTGAEGLLPGAALGLLAAAAISYLVFQAAVRLNLRAFFIATGTLLIFIADEGLLGRLLHAFIGYEAAPSLLQVLGYLSYVIFFGSTFWRVVRARPTLRSPG